MCFGCSKEPSHSDGSFEYTQHMCSLENTKISIKCLYLNKLTGKTFQPTEQNEHEQDPRPMH